MPSHWLVFGLTGQVGQALQERLPLPGVEIVAVTRQSGSAAHSTLRWHQGRLPEAVTLAEPFPVVLSLGPLDLFVQWFEQAAIRDARVLALGSMSLHFKAMCEARGWPVDYDEDDSGHVWPFWDRQIQRFLARTLGGG